MGKIIIVDEGEIYLLADDPEIHLEPLTRLAIIKRAKKKSNLWRKNNTCLLKNGMNQKKGGEEK